jgi:hypothetical protein
MPAPGIFQPKLCVFGLWRVAIDIAAYQSASAQSKLANIKIYIYTTYSEGQTAIENCMCRDSGAGSEIDVKNTVCLFEL